MRIYFKTLLLLLLPVFGLAQDKVVIISPAMFNKATDQVFLKPLWMDGSFKTGKRYLNGQK